MAALDEILFSIGHSASSLEAAAVDQGLGDFNRQVTALRTVEPLVCCAKLTTGEVVGGAVGRTWGDCCELQQLWVAEAYQRRGIGTQLIKLFEERGATRGCYRFYLETFSFQSPEFYRSLGYEVAAEIKGFPEEITKYIMVREVQ